MDEIDERTARERARWRTEASDSAAWDARALVSDLRKGERVQDAIAVGEEALAVFSAFEPLRSAVAWAYYDRDLKHLDETSAREARAMARNAVERIGQLTADDPYGRFSPWPRAVLRLAKVLQDRWPAAALEQLQRLDPTRLSSDSSRDYPSDAGRWRLSTTRVLENLAQWADLLEACDEALRSPGLREVDKTWLQLRRSTALTSLGRYADSIEVLLEFRKQSDPWWVNARLAEVYAAVDDAGTALAFARRALADGRDLDKKWKVVRRVERLLRSKDQSLADRHLQLARHLRVQAGWPIDRELEADALDRSLGDPDLAAIDPVGLRRWWDDAPDPDRKTGIVTAHLHGGGSGFISTDDGSSDLYFAMPRSSNEPLPPVGARVAFVVRRGFDKAKNRPSDKATDVTIIGARRTRPEGSP